MTSCQNNLRTQAAQFAVVAAVNDDAVLQSCLLRSPELGTVKEFVARRGFDSAGKAYDSGLDATTAEVVVFAHQDVFLPDGWFKSVSAAIEKISVCDPDWAVLGVFGRTSVGAEAGYVYSCGLQRILGQPFEQPVEIRSLDEVVLILRRSSGLRFDEGMPGFHLYGTDICLEAQRRGLRCYAISAFCVHNSNGLNGLPRAYSRALSYVRKKWRKQLPIRTPCMEITRWGIPFLCHRLETLLARNQKSGVRCSDPAELHQRLIRENLVRNIDAAMGAAR